MKYLICVILLVDMTATEMDTTRGRLLVTSQPPPVSRRTSVLGGKAYSSWLYECNNGSFILQQYVCDGTTDCPDGDDESHDACRKNQ
jgi:hypothetical protein